ncbi:MAG TPA: nucleotidyltransferase domain-containing protein [Firmicutes bacterium]|nr:nucleotidyltransferase domain-containing protein [Bacillota bacterium]HBR33561.1 nucleotidyltransferase domain-containing protein [Bacillota bacterium]
MKKELMKTKIAEVLALKPYIRFAYLFGSQAKGAAGVLSDIDIAVFFGETATYVQESIYGLESELVLELEKSLEAGRVDLVVLNKAPIFLRYQVLKGGEIIYCCSEEERVRFHEETIRSYLDFQPFRAIQNSYLQKRIEEGAFGR